MPPEPSSAHTSTAPSRTGAASARSSAQTTDASRCPVRRRRGRARRGGTPSTDRRPRAARVATRPGRDGGAPAVRRADSAGGRRAGPRGARRRWGPRRRGTPAPRRTRRGRRRGRRRRPRPWPSSGWTDSTSVQRFDRTLPSRGARCRPNRRSGRARSHARITRRQRQPYTTVRRQWRSTCRSNASRRCARRKHRPVTTSTHSAAAAGRPPVPAAAIDRATTAARPGCRTHNHRTAATTTPATTTATATSASRAATDQQDPAQTRAYRTPWLRSSGSMTGC